MTKRVQREEREKKNETNQKETEKSKKETSNTKQKCKYEQSKIIQLFIDNYNETKHTSTRKNTINGQAKGYTERRYSRMLLRDLRLLRKKRG